MMKRTSYLVSLILTLMGSSCTRAELDFVRTHEPEMGGIALSNAGREKLSEEHELASKGSTVQHVAPSHAPVPQEHIPVMSGDSFYTAVPKTGDLPVVDHDVTGVSDPAEDPGKSIDNQLAVGEHMTAGLSREQENFVKNNAADFKELRSVVEQGKAFAPEPTLWEKFTNFIKSFLSGAHDRLATAQKAGDQDAADTALASILRDSEVLPTADFMNARDNYVKAAQECLKSPNQKTLEAAQEARDGYEVELKLVKAKLNDIVPQLTDHQNSLLNLLGITAEEAEDVTDWQSYITQFPSRADVKLEPRDVQVLAVQYGLQLNESEAKLLLAGQDPWELLGLSHDATESAIKNAYKKLALKYHPDKGGDPEMFKEVGQAKDMLLNLLSSSAGTAGLEAIMQNVQRLRDPEMMRRKLQSKLQDLDQTMTALKLATNIQVAVDKATFTSVRSASKASVAPVRTAPIVDLGSL